MPHVEKKYTYTLDSPVSDLLTDRRVTVSGWLVPHLMYDVQAMRIRTGETTYPIRYGTERRDVADALPELERTKSQFSGFSIDLEFSGGDVCLEADFGQGYEIIQTLRLSYVGGQPVTTHYNAHLATNWAEHVDLLDSDQQYFYESETRATFTHNEADIKPVAFYLPQFYPIPENDRTWGKGFTEWRNVTTAAARFIGHRQPMLPSDLGFYDLRVPEVMEAQIKIAKQHGLYGFCFYHYWFSGKKLLDKPLDTFLDHPEWDFHFMICWANENWTKRWDGLDNDVIVAQQYLPGDPLHFIQDVEHILLDPRYIRVDNKPVLAVYRVADLKPAQDYVKIWRNYFLKKHKLELHLVSVLSFDNKDPQADGFDKAIEFMPQGVQFRAKEFASNTPPAIDVQGRLLDSNYQGKVFDYRAIVLDKKFHHQLSFEPYNCLMPSWDKDARKKGVDSATFYNSSPDLYAHWLDIAVQKQVKLQQPLLFINAWNEWAEGTVLEPSLHHGHAALHRTAEVLAKYSSTKANRTQFPMFGIKRSADTDLAVVVHVYYPDQWKTIAERLQTLGQRKWDLFVTLTAQEKDFAKVIIKQFPKAQAVVVPNRGRDMLPFIHVARRLETVGYAKVLKLHTKKSLHRKDGAKWFNELVGTLLPNQTMVDKVIAQLDAEPSIIGPKGHYVSLDSYIGSNLPTIRVLRERMDQPSDDLRLKDYGYFAGSMFWADLEALKPIFDLYLMADDFESEQGQIDATMAHALERLIGIVAEDTGIASYTLGSTLGKWRIDTVTPHKATRRYRFV